MAYTPNCLLPFSFLFYCVSEKVHKLLTVIFCTGKSSLFLQPINTFFPANAKPYFRIRSAEIPFAVNAASYCLSFICESAASTVSRNVCSSSVS